MGTRTTHRPTVADDQPGAIHDPALVAHVALTDQPVAPSGDGFDFIGYASLMGRREQHDTDPAATERVRNGKREIRYAFWEDELDYIQTRLDATNPAFAKAYFRYMRNRIDNVLDAAGQPRWRLFNEKGQVTAWLPEDYGIEDMLYKLWQRPDVLMTVFDGNPPAMPHGIDQDWIEAAIAAHKAPTDLAVIAAVAA